LRLKPDRIGHGTFISPSLIGSPHLLGLLKENNIPVGTQSLISFNGYWLEARHLKRRLKLKYLRFNNVLRLIGFQSSA
jgi:hypothetical protein